MPKRYRTANAATSCPNEQVPRVANYAASLRTRKASSSVRGITNRFPILIARSSFFQISSRIAQVVTDKYFAAAGIVSAAGRVVGCIALSHFGVGFNKQRNFVFVCLKEVLFYRNAAGVGYQRANRKFL